MNTLIQWNKFQKSDRFYEFKVYLTSCSCCRMSTKQQYKYVKYEDEEILIQNNILYNMNEINFTPDIEWTNCALYEDDK